MDQKNFIVAIVLSVLIIVGWQYAFPPKHTPPQQQQQQTTTQSSSSPGTSSSPGPSSPSAAPGSATSAVEAFVPRAQALARSPRVTFNTPELIGSIDLKGARVDDVQLAKQRETLNPDSPPVPVLSPVGSEHPYYAEFGWSASDASIKLPGSDTLWTADKTTLAPGQPV